MSPRAQALIICRANIYGNQQKYKHVHIDATARSWHCRRAAVLPPRLVKAGRAWRHAHAASRASNTNQVTPHRGWSTSPLEAIKLQLSILRCTNVSVLVHRVSGTLWLKADKGDI